MDWKSIAGAVAPFAPTLGKLLGTAFGPFGSIVGGIAGRAIAGAFGVEATPQAVGAAIAKDANAVEKLKILEATRAQEIISEAQVEVARLEASAKQAESIGVTQRAELAAGVSWWHWRHLLGYVFMLFALVLTAGFAKVMFLSGDLAAFTQLVAQAAIVLGILGALLGYVAQDTTKLKTAAVTGEQPNGGGVLDALRSVLVKK